MSIVTLFARPPECPFVSIVSTVAGVAGGRSTHLHGIGFSMACMTLQILMTTRQRVASLSTVIEPPTGPTVGIVAGRAIGAEPADMMFVVVATGASLRRILE